ncbi:hypothetical protein [Microbulbifer celer]|uniref:hypothetical protein n=1 Tax=Microbulbifer celer TaxID=435905 RepID=UPI001E5C19DA|nr:hypothetical protein [Microbulbifer celer]UFN55868.1 hypothetical protein LPW13_09770 [Microbulbifer celer]UFN58114.1 hypothetical protein LPW13_03430 [Microbulbifer celer]
MSNVLVIAANIFLYLGLIIMFVAGIFAVKRLRNSGSIFILLGAIITVVGYTMIKLGIPSFPGGVEFAEDSFLKMRALLFGVLQASLALGHLSIAIGVFLLVRQKNT